MGVTNQEVYERLKMISERLKKDYGAEEVILFGSYAKGEATEDSDVDLFIIYETLHLNAPIFSRG